ncbi:sensor histidine kinase [Halodesulfovibrio marinisediminis]|uniref:histidine kinase n=1 Tax=Halodesulfovibrio marinisediminis DSM 17456 TaxID=1121457 RepID=A0A1N6GLN2_9BACT|nr:HAMP domain-containing sensor histidine kinase [Halodesulfovibrio marinisediminis]SIO08458.1 Signal transduction histidine kinase [Halodesulfovibrio marinisediminis DSM 17456]
MEVKSISAKLATTFILILTLSLTTYVILFVTVHRDTERFILRSIPMISTLLETKFARLNVVPHAEHAENQKDISSVLKDLQKILQADYLWVITPNDAIITSPKTVIPKHTLFALKRVKENIQAGHFYSQETEELQALIFPISLWNGKGKIVIVQQPSWSLHKILIDCLFPTVITGLLIGIIVLPLIKRTLRPLKELETKVINFATGDLSERITPVHDDEVGRLSRTFNIMADNLEQMTRFRHELTANISHELRSPLTRIQMSEELAHLSCKQHNYDNVITHLNSIRNEVEELDRLVEEILKLSKMDVNSQIGEIGACDLTDTMQRLLRRNSPIIERKNISVQATYSHDCVITCNYPMVKLALSNLMANALKFSPENGTIRITTFSNVETVSVEIFNSFYRTLTPSELISIFEPFSRAEGENIPGTGLGLALVSKVTDQHQGTVTAKNRSDGILFRLTLPRALAEQEKPKR